MKRTIIVIIIIVGIVAFVQYRKVRQLPRKEQAPIASLEDSVKGCYVAHLAKDIYSLKISSQQGEAFEGTLVFKNFEKDSSSGTYLGTYKDGILLGDYSFNSEGMNSVMQVIFKKQGADFVRGYGAMNERGDGFADINNITYDSSYVFKAVSGECATPS